MHKQRLITAAVVGAVATGFGALTVTAPPLLRNASADEKAAGWPSQPKPVVARLEPAPHWVQADPPAQRLTLPGGSGPEAPWSPHGLRHQPLIIGHRGASAYRPEETLDSYRLAIAQGADYIEADLVLTSDDALVARHENELSTTTDVAQHPEFADRKRTKTINGVTTTGWFTEDFTLAELRTLRAVPRRFQPKATSSTIPTLQEIIDLAKSQHRSIGLYLELKTPTYFTSLGLAPEPRLVDALVRNHLTGAGARVYVECFEAESLRTVHRLVDVPEIQLIGGANPTDAAVQPDGLDKIGQYAVGIGIDRARVASGTKVIGDAHADGLEVHVFTFGADAEISYRRLYGLGVDGVFTDNPDLALTARRDAFPSRSALKAE